MASRPLPLRPAPIEFGTDGWRGVLGVDITIERLLRVAAASAQELAFRAPKEIDSRTIVIGFDRRFLAQELAQAIASAVRGVELNPLIAATPLPTPACSWAVVNRKALGALVITASHNPPEWLGLKIKGPFGGSVEGDFTKAVEKRLLAGSRTTPIEAKTQQFDAREEHLDGLREKINLSALLKRLREMDLKIIVDSMHGTASGCISDLFGEEGSDLIEEIRVERDPLFGGFPPEPLAAYLKELIEKVKASNAAGQATVGLAFDGDGDRIAAVDENGRFCTTQVLMPLLVDYLGRANEMPGSVVKTVSGSDLMTRVAKSQGRKVLELPVGFKYIASEMLSGDVLIGGEESGGIGFGMHLPERDALFAALILLESVVDRGLPLGAYLSSLQKEFGSNSYYERIDLRLASMSSRHRLEALFKEQTPVKVANQIVKEVISIDGIKLRLGTNNWLMMRFSGTEPLLRLYCEAPTKKEALKILEWAKEYAEKA